MKKTLSNWSPIFNTGTPRIPVAANSFWPFGVFTLHKRYGIFFHPNSVLLFGNVGTFPCYKALYVSLFFLWTLLLSLTTENNITLFTRWQRSKQFVEFHLSYSPSLLALKRLKSPNIIFIEIFISKYINIMNNG